MKDLLRRLSRNRHPYEPLISIEISRSRLLANLHEYQKLAPGGLVAPVLKSNAYGHGLFEVADVLKDEKGMPFFVVDSYFEALALRSHGVKTPLLIIGYTRQETILKSTLNGVAFNITSIQGLSSIAATHRKISIHIKVDTGMHRQGILPGEVAQAIEIIKNNPNLALEGICTHLSDADNLDTAFTMSQIKQWNSIVGQFKKSFPAISYIHAANTDGSKFAKDIDCNMTRLGIGLYRGVLEMKTIITDVKSLKTGETVGYNNTFKAQKDMTIATIPVGYFEGLDRRLSSNGFVQVGPNKVACPIVGRVSMNITSIDVSAANIKIGDEVVVTSHKMNDPNSMQAHAKRCGTIDYELYVRIPAHLKRIVVR